MQNLTFDVVLNAAIYSRQVDGVSGHLLALGNALVTIMDVSEVGISQEWQYCLPDILLIRYLYL